MGEAILDATVEQAPSEHPDKFVLDTSIGSTTNGSAEEQSLARALPARLDVFIFGIIAFLFFLLLLIASRHYAVHVDDLYSLGSIQTGGVQGIISRSASMLEPIPPLYYLCLWAWNHILLLALGAPFSQFWLLLPSAVCTAGAVFVTGVAARALFGGGPVSWLTCTISATSIMWTQIGLQLRYYGMQYLFAALVVLFFIQLHRVEVNGTGKTRIWRLRVILGLFMALTSFTAYSGLFWLLALVTVDIIFFVIPRRRVALLIPYGLAAIWYSPWLIVILWNVITGKIQRNFNVFWDATPTFSSVKIVYSQVLGNDRITALYLFAIVLVVVQLIIMKFALSRVNLELGTAAIFAACPILMIAEIYIYSAYLFPQGSIFTPRYFLLMWPIVCLSMGYALKAVLVWLHPWLTKSLVGTLIVSAVVVLGIQQAYPILAKVSSSRGWYAYEPWQAKADYLQAQLDIHSKDVQVYLPEMPLINATGWLYLSVTEEGSRPGFSVITAPPFTASKIYVSVRRGHQLDPTQFAQYQLVGQESDLAIWIFSKIGTTD